MITDTSWWQRSEPVAQEPEMSTPLHPVGSIVVDRKPGARKVKLDGVQVDAKISSRG
jgi:hypothetical protein